MRMAEAAEAAMRRAMGRAYGNRRGVEYGTRANDENREFHARHVAAGGRVAAAPGSGGEMWSGPGSKGTGVPVTNSGRSIRVPRMTGGGQRMEWAAIDFVEHRRSQAEMEARDAALYGATYGKHRVEVPPLSAQKKMIKVPGITGYTWVEDPESVARGKENRERARAGADGSGRMYDDRRGMEVRKLQHAMVHGGEGGEEGGRPLDDSELDALVAQRKALQAERAREEARAASLDARFDAVLEEISEREAFLDAMAAQGRGPSDPAVAKVRGEIADRVRELRSLDKAIHHTA